MHVTDAVALQAQANMLIAYNNLEDQPSEFDLTGQDMGGLTLTAGVYSFFDVSPVTGTLTLDAQNNPSCEWTIAVDYVTKASAMNRK